MNDALAGQPLPPPFPAPETRFPSALKWASARRKRLFLAAPEPRQPEEEKALRIWLWWTGNHVFRLMPFLWPTFRMRSPSWKRNIERLRELLGGDAIGLLLKAELDRQSGRFSEALEALDCEVLRNSTSEQERKLASRLADLARAKSSRVFDVSPLPQGMLPRVVQYFCSPASGSLLALLAVTVCLAALSSSFASTSSLGHQPQDLFAAIRSNGPFVVLAGSVLYGIYLAALLLELLTQLYFPPGWDRWLLLLAIVISILAGVATWSVI